MNANEEHPEKPEQMPEIHGFAEPRRAQRKRPSKTAGRLHHYGRPNPIATVLSPVAAEVQERPPELQDQQVQDVLDSNPRRVSSARLQNPILPIGECDHQRVEGRNSEGKAVDALLLRTAEALSSLL